jgi:hypothetical protein
MTPNNAPIVDVARGIRVERLFVDFGLFETVSRAFHFIVQKKVMPSLRLKGRGSAASVRQAVRAKVVLL